MKTKIILLSFLCASLAHSAPIANGLHAVSEAAENDSEAERTVVREAEAENYDAIKVANSGPVAKFCKWKSGNGVDQKSSFDLSLSNEKLTISNLSSEEPQQLEMKGNWKFVASFKDKKKKTFLKFERARKSVNETDQVIVEPSLLKAGNTGVVKYWYNNGDGFISDVFECSDKK